MSESANRLTDGQITDAVTLRLQAAGIAATSEHTGGGIFCVVIADDPDETFPETFWFWGMANETWGGSLIARDGENVDNLDTTVPSDSQDVDAIAAAIIAAMATREADDVR